MNIDRPFLLYINLRIFSWLLLVALIYNAGNNYVMETEPRSSLMFSRYDPNVSLLPYPPVDSYDQTYL